MTTHLLPKRERRKKEGTRTDDFVVLDNPVRVLYTTSSRRCQQRCFWRNIESYPIQDEPGGGIDFQHRMSRRIHHAPPLTNILIYGNIIVNGNACPKQETLPTLRRIVVAPEGRRPEALRKVPDALLEQTEASKEDESMTPKSPTPPKEPLSTCLRIMC